MIKVVRLWLGEGNAIWVQPSRSSTQALGINCKKNQNMHQWRKDGHNLQTCFSKVASMTNTHSDIWWCVGLIAGLQYESHTLFQSVIHFFPYASQCICHQLTPLLLVHSRTVCARGGLWWSSGWGNWRSPLQTYSSSYPAYWRISTQLPSAGPEGGGKGPDRVQWEPTHRTKNQHFHDIMAWQRRVTSWANIL